MRRAFGDPSAAEQQLDEIVKHPAPRAELMGLPRIQLSHIAGQLIYPQLRQQRVVPEEIGEHAGLVALSHAPEADPEVLGKALRVTHQLQLLRIVAGVEAAPGVQSQPPAEHAYVSEQLRVPVSYLGTLPRPH